MASFESSSASNPCPVCNRTHDDGCQISGDGKTVLCRSKAHNGSIPAPPDEINGYKFTGKINSGVLDRAVYVLVTEKQAQQQKQEFTFDYPDGEGNNCVRTRRVDPGNGKKKIVWQEYWIEDDRLAKFRTQDCWVKLSQKDVKSGKATKEERALYEQHQKELAVKVLLYQVKEALQLHRMTGIPLFVVEGETTAKALMKLGIPATTSIGGAKKFNQYGFENYKRDLQDFESVVICPDCDQDGYEHAEQIYAVRPDAEFLYANPTHPRWKQTPWVSGYDLKNWIEDGATKDQILSAIEPRRELPAPQLSIATEEESPTQPSIKWDKVPHSVDHHLCRYEWRGLGENRYQISVPVTNFDFVVERILSSDAAGSGGGLVLAVSRVIAGKLHVSRVIVDSQKDCGKPADFVNAIKRGLGVNVVSTLKPDELQSLLAVKEAEYYEKGGQVYKLIDRIGQQEDGTWVTANRQFTPDGRPTDEEHSRWVFNDRLSEEDFIPHPIWEEPDQQALPDLLKAALGFFKEENFMHFLIDCGWVTAGVHYQSIMRAENCFPLLNPYGDKGSGKTTSLEAALSMVGWTKKSENCGTMAKTSVSALYERLKLIGSLPILWDDPPRGDSQERKSMDELLKSLYNAHPRVVRGNEQKPKTSLAVTTNHSIGDGSDATRTRLLQQYIPARGTGGSMAYEALQEAIAKASGCFSDLIALGYNKKAVAELAVELEAHLAEADKRIARSIALVVYYAEQVAKLGGIHADVKRFAIEILCPAENDAHTAKDSLSDFLEKLTALQSAGHVGEWNCRIVETSTGKFLAMHMPSVWTAFDRMFAPAYSQNVVRRLVEEKGGVISSTQKFPASADMWKAYERKKLELSEEAFKLLDKPESITRKCILLPMNLAGNLIESDSYVSFQQNQEKGNAQDLEGASLIASSFSSYSSYIHNSVRVSETGKNQSESEKSDLSHEGTFSPVTRVIAGTNSPNQDTATNSGVPAGKIESVTTPDAGTWQTFPSDAVIPEGSIVRYSVTERVGRIEGVPDQHGRHTVKFEDGSTVKVLPAMLKRPPALDSHFR